MNCGEVVTIFVILFIELFISLILFQIREIIAQGIEVPEGQNDLRRQQLRELALLNGTLRENDSLSYVIFF